MTTEQYADAYTAGFSRTIAFLCSRRISREDAEDAAQEAWIKGWIRRDDIRNQAATAFWVNSIAMNVYRAKLRSADALRHLCSVAPRETPADGVNTLDIDRRKLMRMVPVQHRELMRDYYVDGYSSSELGQRWGVNQSTIKIRLMRASDRLRREVVR